MEQKFTQLQVSLFFKSNYQGAFENASLTIKEKFGSDIDLQIISLPDIAPPEIPRIVAKMNNLDINLSKNRVDFFSSNEAFIPDNFSKIFSIIDSLAVDICRVGVVVRSFKVMTLSDLKEIFNKEKISSLNIKDVNLRINEETTLDGFKINNSQTYATGLLTDKETNVEKSGFAVTRDINTLIEDSDKNHFTKELLNNFINEAIKKGNIYLF